MGSGAVTWCGPQPQQHEIQDRCVTMPGFARPYKGLMAQDVAGKVWVIPSKNSNYPHYL